MTGDRARPAGDSAPSDSSGADCAGTPAPTASPAWYVVYAKPHKAESAIVHLRRKAVDVFYPQLLLPEYARARRPVVPLFPNYLFVRIDLLRQFYDVVWTPGVRRFVGPEGRPAPLDDAVVLFLATHAGADGVIRARPTLEVGQEVEITRGPFAGLVGIIQRPPNARGRIRVLMRLLNRRTVRVDVPVQHVRTGWAVAEPAAAARRSRT